MLQAILFDLDGTLLPMDNDSFTKYYFKLLAQTAYPWGYTNPQELVKIIWAGVEAMVRNDGSCSNFEAFWQVFEQMTGKSTAEEQPRFDTFYAVQFHGAKAACHPTPRAKEAVALARSKAEKVILATNPIFPMVGDDTRMSWLGLTQADFDLVTAYENSCHSKPNPAYYRDILDRFDLDPAQCLMIGNDAEEDMAAASSLGIPCFLIDDYLINRQNIPLTCPHGTYADMLDYLRSL